MNVQQARHELVALWQGALERTLAALTTAGAASIEPQAARLWQLQRLCQFLRPEAALQQVAEAAAPLQRTGVAQLCELLQWQSALRRADGAAEPAVLLLQQQLQRLLQAVAQDCSHEHWGLARFVASGQARRCREACLLAGFVCSAAQQCALAQLEAHLILWHAAGEAPTASSRLALQQQVLALASAVVHADDGQHRWSIQVAPAQRAAAVADEPLVQRELAQLYDRLQPLLRPSATVTEDALIACCRRSWVLAAVGNGALAEVGSVLYQLLVQHWQFRSRPAAAVTALLDCWLTCGPAHGRLNGAIPLQSLPAATLEPASPCWPLLGAAVADWPQRALAADAAVQLTTTPDAVPQCFALDQLPEYLAATLDLLLQVQPSWFATRSHWQRRVVRLQQELQLLEQGAAALGLLALEAHISALLDLHAQLRLGLPQVEWPATLLWHAHDELVALLDRAALWQEPLPAAAVSAALSQALQQGEVAVATLLQTDELAPTRYLSLALSLFGWRAVPVLGCSVRIECRLPQELSPVQLAAWLSPLQQLLRWLLLQHGSSADLRRRQPQACCLVLRLRPGAADGCDVDVQELGQQGLPGSKTLQRLQRRLGPEVQGLHCSEQTPGRRWHCSLAAPAPAGSGSDDLN